ncbi:MAG: transposase [bacterium]|nr:transposase [bacterium]
MWDPGGMQGTERADRELSDAWAVCRVLVAEGSVYGFLAEHRLRLFPDELFEGLFPSGHSRRSVPGSVVATVLVLQALEGLSDREAVQRLECDLRWKAAAGLGLLERAFHPTVLVLWRQRLRGSDNPRLVFDAVRAVVDECGALEGRSRRALGSTLLEDAVATRGAVTMICAQMRRVRRLVPAAAAAAVSAHDYDAGRAKPDCDWADPGARGDLVDALVDDALATLDAVAGADLDGEAADAVGLLGVVAGQDVEEDPAVPGRWRVARAVAEGRVVSTVDPQARHARKSRSRRRDGYKAHISAEPSTGLICAAELTAADVPDAEVAPRLLAAEPPADTADADEAAAEPAEPAAAEPAEAAAAEPPEPAAAEPPEPREVLGDSAYASGPALEAYAAGGWETTVKPIERAPRLPGGFRRGDFAIDADAGAVTCPQGHTVELRPAGQRRRVARFAARCAACPQRARCTTSPAGRTISVDAYENRRAANKERWADPAVRASYRQRRPLVERSIAWLTRGKARRVPYRGTAANHQWLTVRAAAVNLARLTNLGIAHHHGAFTLHTPH